MHFFILLILFIHTVSVQAKTGVAILGTNTLVNKNAKRLYFLSQNLKNHRNSEKKRNEMSAQDAILRHAHQLSQQNTRQQENAFGYINCYSNTNKKH